MTTVTVSAGNFVAANSLAGPGTGVTDIVRANIAAGAPNAIVVNDGAGALSSLSILNAARGGTGIDTSLSSGVARITAGIWSVGSVLNNDLAGGIARSKLAAGTPGAVLINDGAGAMQSEAQLAVIRGGTGVNTSASSGIPHISSGVWSVSPIVNADVSASAQIARSKLAAGTPEHIVVNAGDGTFSSVSVLPVNKGGIGIDFSGSGAGPFVLELSSGVYTAVAAGSAAVLNTYVKRNGAGGASFVDVGATSVSSVSVLTLNATEIIANAPIFSMLPSTITGGRVRTIVNNLTTGDATFTTIISFSTSAGSGAGTAYGGIAHIAAGDATGGTSTGSISFKFKAKNIGGVLTVGSDADKLRLREGTLITIDAQSSASGTDILIQVRGVVAAFVNWSARLELVSQEF